MERLRSLFEQHFRSPVERTEELGGQLGGSGRQIIRLANDQFSAIGIVYEVRAENHAFVEFSRHFRGHGLPVPEIYAVDLDRNTYLEEDLGDTTLYQFLAGNRVGEDIQPAVIDTYRQVVAMLPRFQAEAGRDLDYGLCYPRHSFDRQSISWDLNYFKYYFLGPAGIPYDEQALEDDFNRLTDFLLEADRGYFLYRDFQSRNIMLRDGNPFFVDYQGGRKGALQYDIASLLYDAKADLPPSVRESLLESYLDALSGVIKVDRSDFMRHYYAYVYVRILQALGAYGFRGFFERKPLFLASVPYALGNLRWLLQNVELPIGLPALTDSFENMLVSEKLQGVGSGGAGITVRVFSFSFHQGHPADETGHGGGFVFDVRNLPNPGREERYKDLTGKDQPVVDYLVQKESVREYFAHVTSLVDASVARYQQRGFKNLMVSFGCTGGQHRSVYLAEQLAKHLQNRKGVDVRLTHHNLEKMG
jgi:aminoglycoside/choline kinase family phosphotransferase